jgi:hypothetical protein
MTSYGVPGDTVPHDGYPYYADLCPTCQEPRPFRIEEADEGDTTGTCAVCGYVRVYHFMDSPGTSPEVDDDETVDAMRVPYREELWLGMTPCASAPRPSS